MQRPPPQQHRPRRCRRRMEAKYRRRRFAVGTAALGIVGTLVVGGLALGHLQSNLDSSPLRSDDSAEVLNDNTHGTNILILGSDTRDLDGDEYGDAGGARSDAMVLAHLSEDGTRIGAIQIPRDTMMDLPACPPARTPAAEPPLAAMVRSTVPSTQVRPAPSPPSRPCPASASTTSSR